MRKVVIRRSSGGESGEGGATSRNTSSASSIIIRYAECEKNHAANVGGYAVDGCREFMACNGEIGSLASLTCAACGCHRNYHRREYETHDAIVAEYSSSSPNSSSN